jgi:DNA repair protein RecN (Recombination protein N)
VLTELTVRNLGVIEELTLVLGPGMTALTGETGAGKTLVVEAIELLVGGRPDTVLVRPGADEARVEGRFVGRDGSEVVLSRAVPAAGRSRAYVDGRMAPVAVLVELGAELVDLHGQHTHQALLSPAVQRAALDRFGRLDDGLATLGAARSRVLSITSALSELGGDGRARAREIDLLTFQLTELEAAAVDDPDEEAALTVEEDRLAGATAHREAGAAAYEALQGDGGARDALGTAVTALAGRAPFAQLAERLRSATVEVGDAADSLRDTTEGMADDPQRLDWVRARRHLLRELRRKYGETLADVIAFATTTRARLDELTSYEARAAMLEADRAVAAADVAAAAAALGVARREAAPSLAAAVEANLQSLALAGARFAVTVDDVDPGDDVVFGLGANPGEPVLPLAKVASGGELARTMLAARLVLSEGPPTMVFDEVDAGIGGQAAVAVGRSLAALGAGGDRQVLVVTHLAQVAAYADAHIAVTKSEEGGRTVARAVSASGEARIVELSRMLSGRPDSASARQHAAELLTAAATEAGREAKPGGPAAPGRKGRRSP